MKISMIGCGKLGGPCAEVMSSAYDVVGYDTNNCDVSFELKKTIKEAVLDRDIIFIAVPTPHGREYDGSQPINNLPPKDFDYSIIQDVLKEINLHINKQQLVVLISTVLPGTTRKYLQPLITKGRFIYNPYLIAMGSVKWDMVNPECLIIGTEDGSITKDAQSLIDFYKPLLQNNPKIQVGTWDEAEAIKIFYNTFISAKIGLVNMIQDVAESNGNINVDIVTNALKESTQRIISPKYLTAGMGDAGACHPRDNIALRWLAKNLNLGYDLFHAIMHSRDKQAEKLANKLIELHLNSRLPIVIHGRAYKPYVEYTQGSYSELIGWFLKDKGFEYHFADPLTNDFWNGGAAIILMAHNPHITYQGTGIAIPNQNFYFEIQDGSIILDPWRTINNLPNCRIIHYGNPKFKN